LQLLTSISKIIYSLLVFTVDFVMTIGHGSCLDSWFLLLASVLFCQVLHSLFFIHVFLPVMSFDMFYAMGKKHRCDRMAEKGTSSEEKIECEYVFLYFFSFVRRE
jgi:hypothetical protein